MPLKERVPEFRYRLTLEEEGEANSDHIANCDEENGEDGVAERFIGVQT